jgi:hypothetical protein
MWVLLDFHLKIGLFARKVAATVSDGSKRRRIFCFPQNNWLYLFLFFKKTFTKSSSKSVVLTAEFFEIRQFWLG